MNDLTATARLSNLLNKIITVLGPDASLRQALALCVVASAGASGTDAATVEKLTASSQAATSRNLKLLVLTHGLAEYFLDAADGRRRLVRLTPQGTTTMKKLLKEVS